MLAFVIYLIIFIAIIKYCIKNGSINNLALEVIHSKFGNVNPIYSTTEMSAYTADRHAENFLFALKNYNTEFSMNDLNNIYDLAQKNHIHSIILITNINIEPSSALYKKVKEYDMQIWNSVKLNSMLKEDDYTYSSSPLKTSDTSDDVCEIDESFDPIQDGTLNTHGIFSIFNNKVERL